MWPVTKICEAKLLVHCFCIKLLPMFDILGNIDNTPNTLQNIHYCEIQLIMITDCVKCILHNYIYLVDLLLYHLILYPGVRAISLFPLQ